MNLFKLFEKPTQSAIKRGEYLKGVDENKYTFHELYTTELLEWIANTNDPILLACASHLIRCWDWPNYLPKPKPEYDIEGHGWNNGDYKSVVFAQKLTEQLEQKAEMLSPGLSQSLWLGGYYRKFSTKSEINNVQSGVGTYVSLDSMLLHFGQGHVSLRLIWGFYGIQSIQDAKLFTRWYGRTPDELYPWQAPRVWKESFAPKCPHCHKACSAAGGLINQTVSHWKCFDCNYEVDDIPAQTVQ